jgi:hypothetical protein
VFTLFVRPHGFSHTSTYANLVGSEDMISDERCEQRDVLAMCKSLSQYMTKCMFECMYACIWPYAHMQLQAPHSYMVNRFLLDLGTCRAISAQHT